MRKAEKTDIERLRPGEIVAGQVLDTGAIEIWQITLPDGSVYGHPPPADPAMATIRCTIADVMDRAHTGPGLVVEAREQ